jgi:glycerol-3-phosphate dehydrogenase
MQNEYDVVIVGGGIQGCAVAQACAAAGFSTLLLEKNTYASATSRSSSKLIHGGLRYLQTAQFSLVRECLEEREWMLQHIPSVVKANWFYIPIYRSSTLRPWKIFAGLSMYQMLSGFTKHSLFKRVPKSQWKDLAGLSTHNLQAVFAYQDAQTDDKHLTQLVQQSAAKLGAECLEHAQLSRAAKFSDGYHLCFQQNDTETCIKTKLVVNATGPWVNHALACFTPSIDPVEIDLVQGAHIVIEERVSDECFYLEAPSDNRAVFVLPWKGKTMIGTTETMHSEAPEEAKPHADEITYLRETFAHYFPDHPIKIVESFCGLRVLPKAKGRAFTRPREVILKINDGLISLYGGKLTSWRATAEKVLGEIEKQLGEGKPVDTRKISL